MWCGFVVNAGWAAREDEAMGPELCDFSCRHVEANNFRIHLALANPSRDHLCVLGAEIENENS